MRKTGLLFLALFVAGTGTLAVGARVEAWRPVAIPTALGMWLLALRSAYLFMRSLAFRYRERKRRVTPAEPGVAEPQGLKRVQDIVGDHLHEGQRRFLPEAVAAQGRYLSDGIAVAALPPFALLLLAAQVVLLDGARSPAARGLVFAEVLCLGYLIYLSLTRRTPASEWVRSRLRTELLRREQYLQLVHVGPYQDVADEDVFAVVRRRRAAIEAASEHELRRLIDDRSDSGEPWIEHLYSAHDSTVVTPADAIDRMTIYLHRRVLRQSLWFANEMRDLSASEGRLAGALKLALIGAFGVAVLHAAGLHDQIGADPPGIWETVVTVLGFVLPPIGAAMLSIQNLYNYRGRFESYGVRRRALRTSQADLENLIERWQRDRSATLWLQFRALVLRTEASLSSEMNDWLRLMARDEFDVAP